MNASLSPLKQAYLAIEKLEGKLARAERAKNLPIAVVGIGCRFPGGANDPETFWQNLRNGVDGIREVPADRWDVNAFYDPDPEVPGKSYVRKAGFIERVDQFDPQFFGIAPREAVAMDPQQRLLLEVAWEALEHAAIAPDKLSGSRSGVFVGIASSDYASLYIKANDPAKLDAYYGSGISHSIAAGRLSYVLGLQGPNVALDTACSSSLVTVHMAVQSLRMGECDLALAGGVNLILLPDNSISFSKLRMLSADGHCKTFDARADGFGDGEGCGMVVLKRLKDAIADRDQILAVIRGSAINQDGASSGLTAPNGPSQEAVIRAALQNGDLEPQEVGCIEAHGTGTSLGDPIEVQALGAVLKQGRPPDRPFYLGSVKTNLGHLEAGAGVAGLIKAILMVQHGEIPAHLNYETPNPLIDWDEIPVQIPTTLTPWPEGYEKRIAGVSAFGFSGTNAHILVEEPPTTTEPPFESTSPSEERPLHLLTLTAKNETALRELAECYGQALANSEIHFTDFAYTANTGRAQLPTRLAVIAKDAAHAGEKLTKFLHNETHSDLVSGEVLIGDPPKVAFLFTGQGAQYLGMGRQLYKTQPIFRAAMERCDQILQPILGLSLLTIIFSEDHSSIDSNSPSSDTSSPSIDETQYTQPALFALEYALAELWKSWGIVPSAVMGHSVGEYVAAVVAGVFSLEDGLKLIAARGRLMGDLPAGGEMAAVFADATTVEQAITMQSEQVSIAALNGPDSTVISGESRAVQQVVVALKEQGIKTRPLKVSHAFHSPLMDPMLDAFESVAAEVNYSAPHMRLISDVSGEFIRQEVANPHYWREHVRRPVQFLKSIETLYNQGFSVFLEIGPNPVLIGMGQRCLEQAERHLTWVPSLKSNRDDWHQILAGLATLFTQGVAVDWAAFDQGSTRRKLSLPTYPFQRQRYWLDTTPTRSQALSRGKAVHPLLGLRLRSASRTITFENWLTTAEFSFLEDHRIFGTAILPGTGYIELALAAGQVVTRGEKPVIQDLTIQDALVVGDKEERLLQVLLTPDGVEEYQFEVFSQGNESEPWVLHASGKLIPAGKVEAIEVPADLIDIENIKLRCGNPITAEEHYRHLAENGLTFGKSLQGVNQLWQGENEALGKIQLTEAAASENGFILHPALLDAHLQVIAAAIPSSSEIYLPIHFERVQLLSDFPNLFSVPIWSYVQLVDGEPGGATLRADLTLFNEAKDIVALLQGITLKQAESSVFSHLRYKAYNQWLYQVVWRPAGENTRAQGKTISPKELAKHLDPKLARLYEQYSMDEYINDLLPEFDRLTRMYIVNALLKLGWNPEVGQHFTTAELANQLKVVPEHRQLVGALLRIMAQDGILLGQDQSWEVRQIPKTEDTQTLYDGLISLFTEYEGELEITGRCGVQLAEALSGTTDPLQLLFPGGSLDTAEKIYQKSPAAQTYNGLVRAVVEAIISQMPAEKQLHILEIGAGTGGTSSFVLPILPPERTEYIYTDISPLFIARAQQKFSQYPFVRYQTLDIEQDPAQQGLEDQHFDLVIAANVIHATTDLHQTLQHIRQHMAPNGLFVMLEVTAPQRWVDITFGLTNGWWRFSDRTLRPDYPLLTRSGWLDLLQTEGFVEAATIPQLDANYTALEEAVIVARAPDIPLLATQPQGQWLIIGDQEDSLTLELSEQLMAAGEISQVVSAKDNALESALKTTQFKSVVHLGDLHSALITVQALVANPGEIPTHLWLVTRGAQFAGDVIPKPKEAGLWGLGKVIRLEHPELNCRQIDLDPSDSQPAPILLGELLSQNDEDEIALRSQARLAARLSPTEMPALEKTSPKELIAAEFGSLDSLIWQPISRQSPGRGEVEIRVHATGLNFKDVMNVLGMYPGDPGPLGGECAGVVTAVGEGVTGFSVGDKVMAVAPGSFRTHVVADAIFVFPKPENLSFEQAATLLIPYTTAYFALEHLGKLQTGDRILIHAGAGGVGQAAIRLAQRAGAEIFATAGSPEKRDYLRSLGVPHVMDSRSLDFADEILRITKKRGVDLVLNSLAGEFIPKSLEIMAESGRFLEIGKSGLLTPEQVTEIGRGIQYFVIDWSEQALQLPDLISSIQKRLVADFASENLPPLPLKTFTMEESMGAFRYMQQARHIGKIVIAQEVGIGETVAEHTKVHAEATYLITGGLGGLGLLVAEWLVGQGARSLILMGRSQPTLAAQETLKRLEAAGANVSVMPGDVSQKVDLARVFKHISEKLPPLRGIIHAAGVLDDGTLINQTWERFETVLNPKVTGAFLLHEMSSGIPLDFFIIFSSVASIFGSPGQGNHAAANSILDALAHTRHRQGLPALSINWGVWSQVGAAAERGAVEHSAQQGIMSFLPEDGIKILEGLMRSNLIQVVVSPMDWPRYLQNYNEIPPLLREVAAKVTRRVPINGSSVKSEVAAKSKTGSAFLSRLAETPTDRKHSTLLDFVQGQVAQVLGLGKSAINERVPLSELGLDSLMAVELRNLLGNELALERPLPVSLAFDYPTVIAIRDYLAKEILQLEGSVTSEERSSLAKERTEMLETIEDLSDDDIDRILAKMRDKK